MSGFKINPLVNRACVSSFATSEISISKFIINYYPGANGQPVFNYAGFQIESKIYCTNSLRKP